jgi:hypothetical protein
VFGWLLPEPEPDEPGSADHPVEPLDDEPVDESSEDEDEDDGEPERLPVCAVTAAEPDLTAMPPASPRNASALSAPAATRDRLATCRFGLRGGCAERSLPVCFVAMERMVGPAPEGTMRPTCAVPVRTGAPVS